MNLSLTIVAAALLCGTAAVAQTPPTKPAPTPTVKAMKQMTKTATAPAGMVAPATKPAPAAAAMASKPAPKPRTKAAAPTGRMVQAKLANGKTVTYNCSLAGNKTKKACQ